MNIVQSSIVLKEFRYVIFILLPSVDVILAYFLFHELDGLVIEVALDLGSFLEVVVVHHEFIKLMNGLLEVFDGDVSVLIEVKSHPVVHEDYSNILVVCVDVVCHFVLVFLQDLNHEGDVVASLVVDDVEVVFEWVV